MLSKFDDVQKFSKDGVDATMKSFGATSKSLQAITAEVTNYSKKSFEEGSATMEKLLGAKSIEKAMEIQTAYAKSAYEGFVAQATKMGELCADLAKETDDRGQLKLWAGNPAIHLFSVDFLRRITSVKPLRESPTTP